MAYAIGIPKVQSRSNVVYCPFGKEQGALPVLFHNDRRLPKFPMSAEGSRNFWHGSWGVAEASSHEGYLKV